MNDYITITAQDEPAAPLGEWWRRPPHIVRVGTYAPYRGEGLRPVAIKAAILVPTGKQTERYVPIEEKELLSALLDVAQRKLKPVEFANRFGLLGYNYVVPPNRNKIVNPNEGDSHDWHCKDGDPVDWFIANAVTALTIADLIERLKEARESPGGRQHLANYLEEEITDGPYAFGARVASMRLRQRTETSSPVLAANGILRYLLNANLGDAARRIQSTSKGLRTIFTFRALVQVIYWQLADQIGQSSIHRCIECGRIFTHSNARAIFCPPVGGRQISPCKSRWNVRAFRRKKRKRRKK